MHYLGISQCTSMIQKMANLTTYLNVAPLA